MKQQPAHYTTDILHRIESIEKEVMDLKLSVLKQLTSHSKKIFPSKESLKAWTYLRKILKTPKAPFIAK